jgi:hypothetical protein
MAGAGVIQAEISLELGQLVAQLNQASTAIAKFAQGAGTSIKPANDAVEGLGKTFRDFKRDQVQEGRMVGFYVRELTSFTGASSGTQAALGSLTQGMIGLFTATGPLLYAWAGFEIVKGVAGYFSDASEAIEKAGKAAVETALKMQTSIAGLHQAVAGGAALSGSVTAFGELNRLRSSAQGWDAEARGTSGGESILAANTAKQLWAAFGAKGGQAEMERLAVEMAKENVEAANVEGKKGIEASLNSWKAAFAERTRADVDAAKEANRIRLSEEKLHDKRMFELFKEVEDQAESKRMWRVNAMTPGWTEQLAGTEEEGRGLDFKDKGAIANDALKTLNDQARQSQESFATLGSSIGSAFGAIGEIIGGAAGQVLKVLGQMIQQAIQLAVAMAAASMAWTSPLGMVAIGSIALAGLLGLMAAVPSFEVGLLRPAHRARHDPPGRADYPGQREQGRRPRIDVQHLRLGLPLVRGRPGP